jgi:hypothetical protein
MAGTGLFTVVLTVTLLLPATGSFDAVVILAVLLTFPMPAGATISATVALTPWIIEPRLHVIVLVPVHVPWLGVAET